MKKLGLLLCVALIAVSCGGDEEADAPQRIGKPGTVFDGPAGGRDRYLFAEGDSINFVVSGAMQITIPKGVFKGTAFPADVSFSVKSANGSLIEDSVSFPRLLINDDGRFSGEVSSGTEVAAIVGSYFSDSTSASIDVQGFSARLPTTGTSVKERTIILQGQLNAKDFEGQ